MSKQLYWLIEADILPGKLDAWRAFIPELVKAAQAEPGTEVYEFTISEDGKSCHILERYKDFDAAITHVEAFGKSHAARVMSLVKPTRCVVYGIPDERLKKTLAGFAPVYFKPEGGFSR
jgi:quinol monooxygenase YgiN